MILHNWFTEEMEVCSADPVGSVMALGRADIILYDTDYLDRMRLRFKIHRRDKNKVMRILQKRGDEVTCGKSKGLCFFLQQFFRRPVLVLGVALMLALTLYVPSRVFFIRVEGNVHVPSRQIIERAMECGLDFGASRRDVRSAKMKNALLQALPQLQWAGVNTYGCTAVITVREQLPVKGEQPESGVSSIVAERDAIVESITVLQGNALCKPGQAVKKGQMLVSGYQDCGICIRGLAAKGEVYGRTQRQAAVISPRKYAFRQEQSSSIKKIALLFGKKRINLYKGSGISPTTCAKIYEEKYLTLPGGFILPFGIGIEVTVDYEYHDQTVETDLERLKSFLEEYQKSQMIAGRIVQASWSQTETEETSVVSGEYSCYESIGILRPEENLSAYE